MYSKLADSDYCLISKNCRSANIVVLGSSKGPGKDGFFSRKVNRRSLLFITKNMGGVCLQLLPSTATTMQPLYRVSRAVQGTRCCNCLLSNEQCAMLLV